MKEALRRFGGSAGLLIALAGAGIVWFAPAQRTYGLILLGVGVVLTLAGMLLNSGDLLNLVRGRPFRHGANAVFYSLVALGIVGAVNFLASRHAERFDMTAEKLHSLSPQTVKILDNLDQDVTITAFYSPTMASRQQAEDLLDEYKSRSSHLQVRMIDPVRSPAEAKAYNIEQYGTVVVSCDNGEARITPSTLHEEDLTNALIKATAKEKKAICSLEGNGERRLDDNGPEGLEQAAEALRKENFDVKSVRLLEQGTSLEGCAAVIVAAPTHALLSPEVDAVRAYLAAGGRVLVMVEPHTTTGLEPLLESYGLKTDDDFIVDVNPMARLFGGSPAAPVVYEYGTHAITKDFEGVATIFPTTASVETTTPSVKGVTTAVLAHTGDQSWGETGEMAERVSFEEGKDKPGPLNVAAVAWSSASPPAETDPTAAAPASSTPPGKESRLVLFGDADFACNQALMAAGNKDLFQNTIAWLAESTDLISIRPKSRASQPVILTQLQARVLYAYSLLVSPLIMVALGLGVYFRRRRL